jgi:hypothetical protein
MHQMHRIPHRFPPNLRFPAHFRYCSRPVAGITHPVLCHHPGRSVNLGALFKTGSLVFGDNAHVDNGTRVDFNVPLDVSGYFNGDFNYDGTINVDDYIIDANVGVQGAPFATDAAIAGTQRVPGFSNVTTIPGPGSMNALIGASLLRGCRRCLTHAVNHP